MIEELARLAYEKYDSLKRHDLFIPYLVSKSTLKYYNETNIGSRPSRRGNTEGYDLRDLRAIPFVSSWSQLKQNVPGYFGIGTAIKTLAGEGSLDDVKMLYRDVPFFRALIQNSMMSLFKCNFGLTAYISRDKEFRDFWNMLFDEFKLSKEMMLLISGHEILMQDDPVSRSSIGIREQIILPLLVIQQYALQKREQNSGFDRQYEKMVIRSLYGSVNASRNSA